MAMVPAAIRLQGCRFSEAGHSVALVSCGFLFLAYGRLAALALAGSSHPARRLVPVSHYHLRPAHPHQNPMAQPTANGQDHGRRVGAVPWVRQLLQQPQPAGDYRGAHVGFFLQGQLMQDSQHGVFQQMHRSLTLPLRMQQVAGQAPVFTHGRNQARVTKP